MGCGGGGAGEGPAQVGVAAQVSWAGGLTGTPGPSLVCWFVLTTAGSSEPGVPSLGAAACPDLTSMVLAKGKAGRASVPRRTVLGDGRDAGVSLRCSENNRKKPPVTLSEPATLSKASQQELGCR